MQILSFTPTQRDLLSLLLNQATEEKSGFLYEEYELPRLPSSQDRIDAGFSALSKIDKSSIKFTRNEILVMRYVLMQAEEDKSSILYTDNCYEGSLTKTQRRRIASSLIRQPQWVL